MTALEASTRTVAIPRALEWKERLRDGSVVRIRSIRPGDEEREHAFLKSLSPEDRASRLQERIDDYLAFGIPAIWVIDPETRRGFIYTSEGMREAKDGILRSHDGSLEVPLKALFED